MRDNIGGVLICISIILFAVSFLTLIRPIPRLRRGGSFSIFIASSVVLLLIGGALLPTPPPSAHIASDQQAHAEPAAHHAKLDLPAITADELFQAYKANEVAADQKYKGEQIKLTGIIGAISKSEGGLLDENTYLFLPSSSHLIEGFQGITAYLKLTQASKAGGLSKGSGVTLTCKVRGLDFKGASDLNVRVDHCIID